MKKWIYVVTVISLFCTCSKTQEVPVSKYDKENLSKIGDSITHEAQKVLLQNVSQAIEEGGTDYAVMFCSLEAIPITDSLSNQFGYYIQRLSDKNRNPMNAITEEIDRMAWEKVQKEKMSFLYQAENDVAYYYKPITLAMPTCLKCHGAPEDISESTRKILSQKYPEDKATGYKQGDLRGIWKMKIYQTTY